MKNCKHIIYIINVNNSPIRNILYVIITCNEQRDKEYSVLIFSMHAVQ